MILSLDVAYESVMNMEAIDRGSNQADEEEVFRMVSIWAGEKIQHQL